MPFCALIGLENVPCEFDHRLAFNGQGDGVGVAHEKPVANRLFELADMIADCRLTQAEFSARFGKSYCPPRS